MSTKILTAETACRFIRWIILIIIFQVFNLLMFNLKNNSEGFLRVISFVSSLFGFFLFLLVPYSLVRKELILIRKHGSYFGWLMGFVFSVIISITFLLFTFLDVGLKAYLGKPDLNSSLIILGSVVGAIIEVIIGTFSGGMAQVAFNRKKEK